MAERTPERVVAEEVDATTSSGDNAERPAEEVEEEKRKADSKAAALTLEMVGDLPYAEIRPPENILFVCKLNPVTRSDDLELIFSRFGKILSCEVIKDKKTGDSLQYAFIEFDKQESAEQAYFKMQNVLIDDRRIWVDFSQSVSKLSTRWNTSRSGGKPVRITGPSGGSSATLRRDQDLVFDFDMPIRRDERGGSDRRRGDRHGQEQSSSYRRDGGKDRHRDDNRREHRRPDHHQSAPRQDHEGWRQKDEEQRDRRRYDDERRDRRRYEEERRDRRRYDEQRDRRRYDDEKSGRPAPSRREKSPARSRHVYQ